MEKMVIRTKLVQGISSKIICKTDDNESLLDLELKYGKDYILKEIFDEDMLSFQELQEEYEQFIEGSRSLEFAWMYVVDSKFGIVIDTHIYLYHYNEDISKQQRKLFPWVYAESKKFLGDTWWFQDSEILKDIKSLSVLDFLEKYKGY